MSKKIKLTSVNVIEETYFNFKRTTIETDMTLQKIVNRSLDLYINDKEFKSRIDHHKTNGQENSKF